MSHRPDVKPERRHPILVAIIGALSLIVAALLTGLIPLWLDKQQDDRAAAAQAADLKAFKPVLAYLHRDSSYQLKGEVVGLQRGQTVWPFVQEYDVLTKQWGEAYPQPGPCDVQPTGDYVCPQGYAGEANDFGAKFKFFVAVLDNEGAADDVRHLMLTKEPDLAYATPGKIPNVAGSPSISSTGGTRPK